MGGGTVFSLSVHTSTEGGGGLLRLADGERGGGGFTVNLAVGGREVPHHRSGHGGTLYQVQMGGVPHPRSRWGYPSC